jgi:hypothetical protein
MDQTSFDNQELRKILKEVIAETLLEQRSWLNEIITEALEDVALAEAVRKGLASDYVDRSEVVEVLAGQM